MSFFNNDFSWEIAKGERFYRRKDAIRYLGGECVVCGYKGNQSSLHFHHIDPRTKHPDYGNMFLTWPEDMVTEELDKCILLCANCHTSLHNGGIQIGNKY